MFGNTSFCQTGNECARMDGIYKRSILINDFARWEQYKLTVEKTENNFQFIVDTNATTIFLYKKAITNNLNLHVYQTLNINDYYFNFFLINVHNKDTLYRTKYKNLNIGFYNSAGKVYIWENFTLSVLDTTSKIITPTIFTRCNVMGVDSNSLYLLNFKNINIDDHVCYGEGLFRIGAKDVRCIIPQYHRMHARRDFTKINSIAFITDDYTLELLGITRVEVNCSSKSYYNYTLSYKEQVIDTIVFELPYQKARVNSFNGDTLYIENYKVSHSYLRGSKINEICITDTIKNELNSVLDGTINFYTVDNYILAAKNYRFETVDASLYNKATGTTINNLKPEDIGLGLEIIYLFDKNTMEFLGYPEVVFR